MTKILILGVNGMLGHILYTEFLKYAEYSVFGSAKRMRIPVYHIEAGNRCYDQRVPEEVNRKAIDHSSDFHMPYTERSRHNLLKEGINSDKIFVIGNPIFEVINSYSKQINESSGMNGFGVSNEDYFLVTLHRAENVDEPERLIKFINAFKEIHPIYNKKIVISLHPRTKSKIDRRQIKLDNTAFIITKPLGFFDFIKLEQNAFCVMFDSWTGQEECAIFKVPNVTLRDLTERPETIECGSNIISGAETENIIKAVQIALENDKTWLAPKEYTEKNVSSRVLNILFGYAR